MPTPQREKLIELVQKASGYNKKIYLKPPLGGKFEHLEILDEKGDEIGTLKFTDPVEIKLKPGVIN
jgi:hypothetical protein